MQSAVCVLVRRFLRGQATKTLADGNKRTLNNDNILATIGPAPIHIELAIQRLKWLQQVVGELKHHGQYIAIMFGVLVNVENDASLNTHPHYQQLTNGLKLLRFIDELAGSADAIAHAPPICLFRMPELTEFFINADFAHIRCRFVNVAVPPPSSFVEPPVVIASAANERDYVCLDRTASGNICGQTCRSFEALQLHRVNSTSIGGEHGVLTFGSLVVANICPSCGATHASREATKQHLRKALDIGYRNPQRQLTECQIECPEMPIVCKICRATFESTAEYHEHIRAEFTFPPVRHAAVNTTDNNGDCGDVTSCGDVREGHHDCTNTIPTASNHGGENLGRPEQQEADDWDLDSSAAVSAPRASQNLQAGRGSHQHQRSSNTTRRKQKRQRSAGAMSGLSMRSGSSLSDLGAGLLGQPGGDMTRDSRPRTDTQPWSND